MPKYRVTVTRDVTESARVTVDAPTPTEASRVALHYADAGELIYESDDTVFGRSVTQVEVLDHD